VDGSTRLGKYGSIIGLMLDRHCNWSVVTNSSLRHKFVVGWKEVGTSAQNRGNLLLF
jgi:hypothetical protein